MVGNFLQINSSYLDLKREHKYAIIIYKAINTFYLYFDDAKLVNTLIPEMKLINVGKDVQYLQFDKLKLDSFLHQITLNGYKFAIVDLPTNKELTELECWLNSED